MMNKPIVQEGYVRVRLAIAITTDGSVFTCTIPNEIENVAKWVCDKFSHTPKGTNFYPVETYIKIPVKGSIYAN